MRGRMWFLGGLGVGYLLGSRAGRERYDQIVSAARKFWDSPTVQEAAGVVQAQAGKLYEQGKHVVGEKLHRGNGRTAVESADETTFSTGRPNQFPANSF